jgi:TIR domain-containing protein
MSKINLFISYSHVEKTNYLPELLGYLNEKSCPRINIWYDEKITPGGEWDEIIKSSFNSSQIILLLISQSFLNSAYIRENELNPALARCEAGECTVIPIFVRNCDVESYPEILKLQGLPAGMKFISDMEEEKWRHYKDIAQKINAIAEKMGDAADEAETEKNISSSMSNSGVAGDAKGVAAENLRQLRDSKKIFLSIPDSEEGKNKRRIFISQAEDKKKYEGWPYEIVPGTDVSDEVLKDTEGGGDAFISSFIKDTIYSIHIIGSEHDLEGGINKAQYELAKKYGAGKSLYRNIVWLLGPDIKGKLSADVQMNPIATGSNYENIFDIIKSLDGEKEKKITELKKVFSPVSKIFMFYDFSKDHDSDLRISLKEKIESNENVSVRLSTANQDLEQEKRELENCDGALIFYGASDPGWYSMRQLVVLDAKNITSKAVCVDDPDIDRKIKRDVSKNEVQTIKGVNDLEPGVKSFLDRIQNKTS